MPPVRFQPPDRLVGATAFSQGESVQGSLNLVRLLKSQRWVWDDLRAACALEAKEGRPREAGHWELTAVAFVASGHVDVQPWLADTTDDLWRECGFEAKPTYKRAWRRLRELEEICDAFLDAAGTVVRQSRRHDKRVGAHVHVDGTEDETHAALVHDCKPGECPRRSKGHKSGKGRAGRTKRPQRESTQVFRETRQKLTEQPPETVTEDDLGQPEKVEFVRERGRLIKRIRLRANVAALIEWLRIAHRQGWLGSARRHDGVEQRTSQSIGQKPAAKLARFRAPSRHRSAVRDARRRRRPRRVRAPIAMAPGHANQPASPRHRIAARRTGNPAGASPCANTPS